MSIVLNLLGCTSGYRRTISILAEHFGTLNLQLLCIDHYLLCILGDLGIDLDESTVAPFPTKLKVE